MLTRILAGFLDAGGGGLTVNATLGTADASGYTASVDLQKSITATIGTSAASGYDATVDRQLGVSATLATASANGYDAGIDRQLGISATVGSASASGHDASITFGNDLNVIASLGLASADGYQASVNLQNDIAATLGTSNASGYTATVTLLDLHGFTQEQLDFLVAYMEANMAFPTVEQIAAAVLAAALVTPIHADVRKVNSYTVTGDGTEANPWNPA